jgi:MFS family permease
MDSSSAAPSTASAGSLPGLPQRVAAPLLFVLLGVVFATWAARIPAIRDALQLSPAQLGLALLCAGAGSVGAFPLAAWLVGHHGPRRASLWSGTMLLLVVAGLAWAPDLAALMALMVGFGVFETTFNVSINAVGARMEQSARRSVMSRLHAWYCVGTFGGALLGSALAGARIGVGVHFTTVALLSWAVLAATCAAMAPDRPDAAARPSRLTLPRGPLFTLGVVCFCVAIAEGAITDWSGVYIRDVLGAGEGTAPLAFAAFSALTLAVRWVADPLKDRWGAQRIVAVGGVVAAVGVGLAAAAVDTPLTIAGFALAGAGIAAVFPFVFSAAGRHGATALAGVATMGYSGVLMGPPAIGFVAHWWGMQAGLAVIAVICIAMTLAARRARLLV